MIDPNSITYFAETDARNKKVRFGIKAKDRLKHMYVIGKTGMGKSTLLENMAIQDIQNGNGMAFIDPHGGTAEKLLEYVPEHRIKDVIYFAPFDIDYPISFNVMEDIGSEKRHLVVSGLMSAFKKLFGEESFSDRMQYILQNTILALLEYPGATILGINKMLADKEYRNKVIANITDPSVKSYWVKEYAGYTERFAAEAIPAIQNKIGQFTSNPLIRNIMGQEKSSFDFRDVMDKGKIIIINLSKGKVGEGNANLIGSMIITKIYLAAMSRADRGEAELAKLPNFYLYVDEFQSFANKSFADILSEARKYKLNLTIAHQYIEQMEEEVRDAVFGNVGTMITFRVGAFDAEVLEKEFAPTFMATDLVNLGFAQIYLKLMIDGVSSQPFSATTLGPISKPEFIFKDQVLESSRSQFARKREDVEKNISDWHDSTSPNNQNKEKKENGINIGIKTDQAPRSNGVKSDFVPQRNEASAQRDFRQSDTNKIILMQAAEELKKRQEEKDKFEIDNRPKISLEDLKKEKELSMQVGKKNPSKENISSLKDALAGVLSKKPIDTPKTENLSSAKSGDTTATNFSPEVKKESLKVPSEPSSTSAKEVPESVLREILKMDEK